MLGIVDDSAVHESDLVGGEPFGAEQIGMPRARAAADRARSLRPDLRVRAHPVRFDESTVCLLDDYDVVVDGQGSQATSRLLRIAADRRRIPVVAADLGLAADPVPCIAADALEARLAARARGLDAFTLLDVRERPEHDASSIDGSVLAAGFGSTSAVWPEVDAGSPVVVVCARGDRAREAALLLRARGHDVSVLERGMLGWNLRPSALAGGLVPGTGRVPLPLADIDPEGFRPNLHS